MQLNMLSSKVYDFVLSSAWRKGDWIPEDEKYVLADYLTWGLYMTEYFLYKKAKLAADEGWTLIMDLSGFEARHIPYCDLRVVRVGVLPLVLLQLLRLSVRVLPDPDRELVGGPTMPPFRPRRTICDKSQMRFTPTWICDLTAVPPAAH